MCCYKLAHSKWQQSKLATHQARAKEVKIIATEESARIRGESLGVARNHSCISAARLELEVVEFEDADHLEVAGPRVVADKQVRVVWEEFHESRTRPRARHVAAMTVIRQGAGVHCKCRS